MRLRSASEDFEFSTLRAIAGLLGRLSYLGRLQTRDGVYKHWGMAKAHGEGTAQRAIQSSHRALLATILREPLRALLLDLEKSCHGLNGDAREFLRSLNSARPQNTGRSADAHFRSALNALRALVENREKTSSPGASQPQ